MVGEEILQEIDATLDQLIQNAETIQKADVQELSPIEIEAFQKTQESLIHHFIHMDQLLVSKKQTLSLSQKKTVNRDIPEKLRRFEALKNAYGDTLAASLNKETLPILSKRKTKRFLFCKN